MILAWIVVTVPLTVVMYFSFRKRRRTRNAADMADVTRDY